MDVWIVIFICCHLVGQGHSGFEAIPSNIGTDDLKVLILNCTHHIPMTSGIVKIEIRKLGGPMDAVGGGAGGAPIPNPGSQYGLGYPNSPPRSNPVNPGPGTGSGRGGGSQTSGGNSAAQHTGGHQTATRSQNNPFKSKIGNQGYANYIGKRSTIGLLTKGSESLNLAGSRRLVDTTYTRKRRAAFTQGRSRRKRSAYYNMANRRQTSFVKATLSGVDIVRIVPNNGRFKGTGRMAAPAFLVVEVSHPDLNDAGRYVCSITHMTSSRPVQEDYSIDITATDKRSLGAIEERVSRLENQIPAMSTMGKTMQNIMQDDSKKRKEMEGEIEKLKKENRDLISAVDELKEKFKVLSDRTTALMEAQSARQAAATTPQQALSSKAQNSKGQNIVASKNNKNNKSSANNDGAPGNVVPGNAVLGNAIPGNGRNPNGYVNNNGGYPNYNGAYGNNYMPQQQGNNPFYGNNNNYYPNRAYGGYGQQPPQQQRLPPPQQRLPQQQQLPPQQGYQPYGYNPNGFGNGYNGYQQPFKPLHLKSDDLTKITARMDDLENTRISALEKDLKDMKLLWLEPMSDNLQSIQIFVNITAKPLLDQLESIDWQGLTTRLDTIDQQAIPTLVQNMTIVQKNVVLLQNAMDLIKGRKKVSNDHMAKLLGVISKKDGDDDGDDGDNDGDDGDDDDDDDDKKNEHKEKTTDDEKKEKKEKKPTLAPTTPPLSTTTTARTTSTTSTPTTMATTSTTGQATTTPPPPASGMKCYVCGDNSTRDNCTPKNKDNKRLCTGKDEVFCMTDLFQNGRTREIYKRCVTEAVCKNLSAISSKECATTGFLVPTAMECHYCCTTPGCNSSIRPLDNDMYKGGDDDDDSR